MAEEGKVILRVLGLLIALHVGLAVWYAAITPYRTGGVLKFQRDPQGMPLHVPDIGAPDERQHANYVQHLLDGKGLPILVPGDGENYQSHQPPLYYLLEAGWAKVTGVSDVNDRAAGLRMRLLNALFGGLTVSGVFFIAFWSRRCVKTAACAGAAAALLPMNLALSGAVSNDPLLFALCTWSLALCIKGVQEGWCLRLALWLGLVSGLAMLTKTTALAIIPVMAVAFWLGRSEQGRIEFRPLAAAFGVMLVLAIPWWLRNQSLYGDPFAMKAFNAAFANSPSPAGLSPVFDAIGPNWLPGWLKYWTGFNDLGLGVGWWTLRSFFGAFGYMDIFMHGRIYAALTLVLVVLAIAAWLPDRSDAAKVGKKPHILGSLYFALIALFFLRFNAQFFQGQARYLLPALAPISMAIGVGAMRLSRSRGWAAPAALVCALVAANLAILQWLPGEFAVRAD